MSGQSAADGCSRRPSDVAAAPSGRFVRGGCRELPFEDATFDAADVVGAWDGADAWRLVIRAR